MARRATLKDVAERAQVSTATVSYVLNDKKSADWNCHSTDRARQQTDAAK